MNGNYSDTKAYEQYQWLARDLANVDRSKTPWVIVMGHRPMYSSQVSSYQNYLREAFEGLMLKNGVDVYLAGHIHWYERLLPLKTNGTIDHSAFMNNNTYITNPGVSMTHIINGAAGNIESHSTLGDHILLDFTVLLDQVHFGFSKLTINSAKKLTWEFIHGEGGVIGDELTILKNYL